MELIIVLAIIGIMTAAVLAGGNTRQKRINAANSTAMDLYSALQTEFTNFQMFDGPLTMTLNAQYTNAENINDVGKIIQGDNMNLYGGMKYYPAAGGNYPFISADADEPHLTGTPKTAAIYLRFRAQNGHISVSWAKDIETLLKGEGGSTAVSDKKSELCAVLEQEMPERIEYDDGYYYARISYEAPYAKEGGVDKPTKYDYRARTVKVDWTAFTTREVTFDNSKTYTFKSQNVLQTGQVCGVCGGDSTSLGTSGTTFITQGAGTATPDETE